MVTLRLGTGMTQGACAWILLRIWGNLMYCSPKHDDGADQRNSLYPRQPGPASPRLLQWSAQAPVAWAAVPDAGES